MGTCCICYNGIEHKEEHYQSSIAYLNGLCYKGFTLPCGKIVGRAENNITDGQILDDELDKYRGIHMGYEHQAYDVIVSGYIIEPCVMSKVYGILIYECFVIA